MDYEILQVGADVCRGTHFDTLLWQSFQASCANLEITLEDCFNAWLYFWVAPESYEAANALLCGRKEH